MEKIARSTSQFYLGIVLSLVGVAMAITWWWLLRVIILTGAAILLTNVALRAEWAVRGRLLHRVACAGMGVVMIFAAGMGEAVMNYYSHSRQAVTGQQQTQILQYPMPSANKAMMTYSACIDANQYAVKYVMGQAFEGIFAYLISDEDKVRNAVNLSFYASSLCKTLSAGELAR